jgi:hypothetical protein
MRTRHPGLGRGTDARRTEADPALQAPHCLPSATIGRLGDQEPLVLLILRRFLPNRAVLVLPPRHLGFFFLLMGDSQISLIRPGETQSPPPNRRLLAKNRKILHPVLAPPRPAPPLVPMSI